MAKQKNIKDQKINQSPNTEDKENNMCDKREGVNKFSDYQTAMFYLDFGRARIIKSFQLRFGGVVIPKTENIKSDLRKYKYELKRFFYNKSRDGYYKDRFLFIDGTPDSFELKNGGFIFHDFHFFTEGELEKKFVVEYMETLFKELDVYFRNHKSFEFKRFIPHAKVKTKKGTPTKS